MCGFLDATKEFDRVHYGTVNFLSRVTMQFMRSATLLEQIRPPVRPMPGMLVSK